MAPEKNPDEFHRNEQLLQSPWRAKCRHKRLPQERRKAPKSLDLRNKCRTDFFDYIYATQNALDMPKDEKRNANSTMHEPNLFMHRALLRRHCLVRSRYISLRSQIYVQK